MRRSVAGMSPAKMAIAEQATIAPTAGTGSMKKVTGTRSAIAIVAVRPGIAPTNSPKIDAPRIVTMTSHWKTSPKACSIAFIASPPHRCEQPPRQGHVELIHEEVMDCEGYRDRQDDGDQPADAEQAEHDEEDRHHRQDEAERVRRQDVEQDRGDGDDDVAQAVALARPVGPGDCRAAVVNAGGDQQDAAARQAGGNQCREDGRAILLARDVRKPCDQNASAAARAINTAPMIASFRRTAA